MSLIFKDDGSGYIGCDETGYVPYHIGYAHHGAGIVGGNVHVIALVARIRSTVESYSYAQPSYSQVAITGWVNVRQTHQPYGWRNLTNGLHQLLGPGQGKLSRRDQPIGCPAERYSHQKHAQVRPH